ncbi:hypothetical protein O181_110064 [Austropuccinia psidii MF-1]|uniref:Integrase catalytic domain-containing protein n=1 Tax=Austropuccinia psidii MF-1 TaxID=1389203 RepID=A0A9Q3PQG7_9BASI|nr:hypothetical protein [Austropuccinia psidii MF-1]
MSGKADARPNIVMEKLLELINHQKMKDIRSSGKVSNTSKMTALISNAASYPYKIMYVWQNGKYNRKNMTHKESSFWVEHLELQPPSNCNRKKFNRKDNDAEMHQTGMSAPLTSKELIPDITNTLVVNCGATHHMFNNKELLSNFFETEKLNISTSNPGIDLSATGRGTVAIEVENETFLLPNGLYVPNVSRNLISLLKMFATSITIAKHDRAFQSTNDNKTILCGKISNKLMISEFTKCTTLLTNCRGTQPCWHSRLGHPSNQTFNLMGLPTFEKDHCDVCAKGKMTLMLFKSHFEVVEQPLDSIVDQRTLFKIVKFLKKKSEALQEFKIVKNMIETSHGAKIKKIVSDRGGEFINSEFKQLANKSGFIHVTSPLYTPQWNGFAERANRAILEKARCLLLGANLPNNYWAKAVNHATLLISLIPNPSRNNQSPLYHWTGNSPRIKLACTLGCKVVFAIRKEKRPWKLAPTGEVGILLGLDYESPAYRILKLTDNKVFSTRHVIFFENDFASPNNIPMAKEGDLFASDVERYSPNEGTFFDCQEHAEDEAHITPSEEAAPPFDDASAESSSDNSNSQITTRLSNKIKVIGPFHLTLISSSIWEEHILPYSRHPRALLTSSNNPLSYRQAVK